ncbi:uncharacterized protein [Aegilops tauschii subsp. strangulata]|uniref:uncharacterized protein n=1 Tax=Aegilops tauschii subsp. strangulata TaxID=200361 RepID=UPI003CC8BFC4
MRSQVDLMIEGVPSHVWTRETAAELLGSSYLVDSLAPETASREDLSLFKVRAWCVDPDSVPMDKLLWVPEPEAAFDPAARQPTSRQLFKYKTLIHIGRIREHDGPEAWLRPPSSDGSGQRGLPEDSGDFSGVGEWRVLPWTRGVRDHRGGVQPPRGMGGSYRQVLLGRIGPLSWRLPPMEHGRAATSRSPMVPPAPVQIGRDVHTRSVAAPVVAPVMVQEDAKDPTLQVGPLRPLGPEPVVTPDPAQETDVLSPSAVPRETAFDQGCVVEVAPRSGPADPPNVELAIQTAPVLSAQEGSVEPEAAVRCDSGASPVSPVGDSLGPTGLLLPAPPKVALVDVVCPVVPLANSEGWAPVSEILMHATNGNNDGPILVVSGSIPTPSGLDPDMTTSGVGMQAMQPMQLSSEERSELAVFPAMPNLTSKEQAALSNIKTFCAGLLKKLAPPLLKEFEGMSGVRAGQDPFTPRRATRSTCIGGPRKSRASAAETILLKTLGFDCEDLAISEDALGQLRMVFDSPLQEPQLRAIATIFGKAIPLNLGDALEKAEPVMVQ